MRYLVVIVFQLVNQHSCSFHFSMEGTYNTIASHDQVLDCPSNNYCTWSDLTDGSFITLKEGNLETSWSGNDTGNVISNWGFESGKWYLEIYMDAGGSWYPWIGVSGNRSYDFPSNAGFPSGGQVGQMPDSIAYLQEGRICIGGSYTAGWGSSFTIGDIVSIALDCDNGAVYFAKNGTWQASGVPTSGASRTNSPFTWTPGAYQYLTFNVGEFNSATILNCGQDGTFAGRVSAGGNADGNSYGNFKYAPPTDYLAACSANLSEPTVKPAENFNTVLWTGDGGSNRAISSG